MAKSPDTAVIRPIDKRKHELIQMFFQEFGTFEALRHHQGTLQSVSRK